MEACFCCGRVDRRLERHHIRPKRYFKAKQRHRRHNIVMVCFDCHRRLHSEHDNPRWSEGEYHRRMREINYGLMIYATGD